MQSASLSMIEASSILMEGLCPVLRTQYQSQHSRKKTGQDHEHCHQSSNAQQTQCAQKYAESSDLQSTEMGRAKLSIIPSNSRSERIAMTPPTTEMEWHHKE